MKKESVLEFDDNINNNSYECLHVIAAPGCILDGKSFVYDENLDEKLREGIFDSYKITYAK